MQIDNYIKKRVGIFKISFIVICLFVLITTILLKMSDINKKEDIELSCDNGCSLKELYPLDLNDYNKAKEKVIVIKNNKSKDKNFNILAISNKLDNNIIYYSVDGSTPIKLSDNNILKSGTLKSKEEKRVVVKMWFDKNKVNTNTNYEGTIKFELK